MTIVIDTMDDLADQLGQVEDWLFFADGDAESDEQAETIQNGLRRRETLLWPSAARAGSGVALWWSETELAPVLIIESPLGAVVAAIQVALHELHDSSDDRRQGDRRTQAAATLGLIGRCAELDGTPDHDALAAVLAPGGPMGADAWLAIEGSDRADGGVRRWAKRLDVDQCVAYRRYCQAVLSDPLDQFAAGL